MSETPEREIGIETKFNAITGDFGIGVTWKQAIHSKPIPFFGGLFQSGKQGEPDEQLVDEIIKRAAEYPRPNVAKFAVGSYWQGLEQQPPVTAVISGKGGVGKTSIALGLAEVYSINDNVLIVDFDLHNRGLTSKYGPLSQDATTVLAEIKRFSKTILADERLPRENGRLTLSSLDEDLFHDLREKYCYLSYPRPIKLQPLKLHYLYETAVRNSPPSGKTRPKNCYFLPSRRGGESYLGTSEALLDWAEVAIFLMYLGCLASRNKITRIILDCHGAHDLFMVGAILAAEHLVIVSRPEPAAFEGTLELVRFAESLVESQVVFPTKRSLIFNEFRETDRRVAETLFKAIYQSPENHEKFEDLPTISSSDEVRDLLKFYKQPSILSNEIMGPAIKKLVSGTTSSHNAATVGVA